MISWALGQPNQLMWKWSANFGENGCHVFEEEITSVMNNARYQRSGLSMEMADVLAVNTFTFQPFPQTLNSLNVSCFSSGLMLGKKYFPNSTLFTGALDEFLDSLNEKRENISKYL